MSMNKAHLDAGANDVRRQGPGDSIMSMSQSASIATVGDGTLTATAMLAGIVDRTGPTGNYIDTLDTATNLLAAIGNASPGDSFEFLYRNTVAVTMTLAVAVGAELGANTAMIASNVRRYLVTIMSTNTAQVFAANTVSGTAVISGLTAAQVQKLQPGMGISGSGITGGTNVLSVNPNAGTVTLDANATATATLAALTFFPRYIIRGLHTSAL